MDWTVSKQVIEIHPHPNADLMEIARVGTAQMVVGKGLYKTGDVVLIIAAKSVIPEGIIRDEFNKMLSGPENARRVKAVRLRGEYSEAITWPLEKLLDAYTDAFNRGHLPEDMTFEEGLHALQYAEIGGDLSKYLGIRKYEPPIPSELNGKVAAFEGGLRVARHDCYHLASYADEIPQDERVVVTEKLHGSQLIYYVKANAAVVEKNENGEVVEVIEKRTYRELVSTKNQVQKGIELVEEEFPNSYWQAVRNSNLFELCKAIGDAQNSLDEDYEVQIFGELVPVQKGFSYGQTKPVVKAFDLLVDGHPVAYDTVLWTETPARTVTPQTLFDWTPVLYDGPLGGVDLVALSKGTETVSGKGLHIREGVVVRPYDTARKDSKGNIRLHLKVINPKYKDDEDELS